VLFRSRSELSDGLVEPLGFRLPVDGQGNLLKVSVIGDDEPYELVDA